MEDTLKQAQAGDRNAFDQLTRPFREGLMAFAARWLNGNSSLRRWAEADDVVQETLLKAFQNLGRYEWTGQAGFGAWLKTIAKNYLLALGQRHGLKQTVLGDDDDLERPSKPLMEDSRTVEEKLADHEVLLECFFSVEQKYESYQIVAFVLHKVVDWSVEEIATKWNMRESTLRKAIDRIRSDLKESWERRTRSCARD